MKKDQKIIVVLLILAVVFSVVSVVVNLAVFNLDLPVKLSKFQGSAVKENNDLGNVQLVVESNKGDN